MKKFSIFMIGFAIAACSPDYTRAQGRGVAQDSGLDFERNVPADTKLNVFFIKYKKALKRYYGYYEKIESADSLTSPLFNGLRIVAGEPVEVDDTLINAINQRADGLQSLSREHQAPRLGNPLDGIRPQDAESNDPAIRRRTYNTIEKRFKDFEQKLVRWKDKRNSALSIERQSIQEENTVYEIADTLEKINSTYAGGLLNAFTANKFAYLWADTVTVLTDAVIRKRSAASSLVKVYNRSIQRMEHDLKAFEDLRGWAKTYNFIDQWRVNQADSLLDGAESELEQGEGFGQRGRNTNAPSDRARRVQDLLTRSRMETADVRARVREYLQEADRLSRANAHVQEWGMLLSLLQTALSAAATYNELVESPHGGSSQLPQPGSSLIPGSNTRPASSRPSVNPAPALRPTPVIKKPSILLCGWPNCMTTPPPKGGPLP